MRAGPIEPEEAVSAIRSGDTVVGRFGLVGAPLTLIDALVESSDTDELTIISNYSGERIAAHRARSDRGAIRSIAMATRTGEETRPSERARTLVQGAYDLHVHVGPDVPPRRIDDVTLARRFAEVGLAGFGLKSHYTSTAERAQVVSALVPGVEVVGALALNQAVGGMNALAVEIAAREGGRIVWMPTVDSPAETAGRTEPKAGDKVPQWARLQHELRELGLGGKQIAAGGVGDLCRSVPLVRVIRVPPLL
jgi:hypothetical protein